MDNEKQKKNVEPKNMNEFIYQVAKKLAEKFPEELLLDADTNIEFLGLKKSAAANREILMFRLTRRKKVCTSWIKKQFYIKK